MSIVVRCGSGIMHFLSRISIRILPWDPWLPRCSNNLARYCQDSQNASTRVNPGCNTVSLLCNVTLEGGWWKALCQTSKRQAVEWNLKKMARGPTMCEMRAQLWKPYTPICMGFASSLSISNICISHRAATNNNNSSNTTRQKQLVKIVSRKTALKQPINHRDKMNHRECGKSVEN